MIPPRDPHVTDPAEAKRLSTQCQAILRAFAASPWFRVSNSHLATLALKYTSRISDIRDAGHTITIWSRDPKTGIVIYEYNGWECHRCGALGGNPLTKDHHECLRGVAS